MNSLRSKMVLREGRIRKEKRERGAPLVVSQSLLSLFQLFVSFISRQLLLERLMLC
jgi:hypothetical protein